MHAARLSSFRPSFDDIADAAGSNADVADLRARRQLAELAAAV
jgi:hypothetical protein